MGNYPAEVNDSDSHFDLPSGSGSKIGKRRSEPPKTTMVYCPPCMRHYEAPAREDWWNARVELCPKHQRMADEGIMDEDVEETRNPVHYPENR